MSLQLSEEQVNRLCEIREQRQKLDEEEGLILASGITSCTQTAPVASSEPIPEGEWKKHPASEKQIAILEKFRVDYTPNISKGEASDLIEDLFARRDT